MADQPTTPSPAPAATPGAPQATQAPATPPAAAPVDAAIQAAMDRAAKADVAAYRNEQAAKQAAAEAASLKAQIAALEKDPWSYLSQKGVTPEMLLDRAAQGKGGPSEEVLQLRQELESMKAWRGQVEQTAQEQARQAQLGGIAGQARQLVAARQDPDSTAALAFVDAIAGGKADFTSKVKAYQAQAEASGVVLTADQAAGMLNTELVGLARNFRENKALAESFDRMLGRTPSAAQPPTPGGQPAQPGQTLTSDMAQGGAGGAPPDLSKMTEAQQDAYFRKKFNLPSP